MAGSGIDAAIAPPTNACAVAVIFSSYTLLSSITTLALVSQNLV